MNNITYKVIDNGYEIYNNGILWIKQYEPFIPDHNLSYEENAKLQIQALTTNVSESESLEDEIQKLKEDYELLKNELIRTKDMLKDVISTISEQ